MYGLMDIANIFCQSPGVTSNHENVPYGLPFSNGFGIRLNSSGYPFEKEFVDRLSD